MPLLRPGRRCVSTPLTAPQVGRAHQCPSSFIAAAPTAAAGHRCIPRMGSGGVRWERACCPLRSRRVALLAICCRGASSGGRAWRHMPAKCIPRRPAHSNVCSQCALGRSATARCPRNAFPSAWRWRYVDVMRSQVSDDGNILPRCIPKMGLGRGKGPFVATYLRRVSKNELALAGYAHHASEMPRKSPSEDTSREDLARKGPFSLHKPLESCTARRSCHDSAFARPCERKARGAGYRKCTSYCGRRSHPMIAYVCGSRARSRQLPLCGRWRKPMTVSAEASEQCSGAYARPVLRHLPARSVCLANGIRPPAATFAAGASRRPRAQ